MQNSTQAITSLQHLPKVEERTDLHQICPYPLISPPTTPTQNWRASHVLKPNLSVIKPYKCSH